MSLEQNNSPRGNNDSMEGFVTAAFISEYPYIRYQAKRNAYINYDPSKGTYYVLEKAIVLQMIDSFIKNSDSLRRKKTTTYSFVKKVESSLSLAVYCDIVICKDLCFNNGRLNMKDGRLYPKTPDLYCFTHVDSDFDPNATLTQEIKDFLWRLCGNDKVSLNCFRAWLLNVLLINNKDQYCLYLVGPGSTGKSSIANWLSDLLQEQCLSSSLAELSGRFIRVRLAVVTLWILPDVAYQDITSTRASFLKSVISSDSLLGDTKFKNPVAFKTVGMGLIHGNQFLKYDEALGLDSGIARRILIIETGLPPETIDQEIGPKLTSNTSALINWARGAHPKYRSLAGKIPSLNERTYPTYNVGLRSFVLDSIKICKTGSIQLEAKDNAHPNSVYGAYSTFIGENRGDLVNCRQFSTAFKNACNRLGVQFSRKSNSQGIRFIGISLAEGQSVVATKDIIIRIFEHLDPFMDFDENSEDVIFDD